MKHLVVFSFLFLFCMVPTYAFILAPSTIDLGNVLPGETYDVNIYLFNDMQQDDIIYVNGKDCFLPNENIDIKKNSKKNIMFHITIPEFTNNDKQSCAISFISGNNSMLSLRLDAFVVYNVTKDEIHNLSIMLPKMTAEQFIPTVGSLYLTNKGNVAEDISIVVPNIISTNLTVYPYQERKLSFDIPQKNSTGTYNFSLLINDIPYQTTIDVVPTGSLSANGSIFGNATCVNRIITINGIYYNTGTLGGIVTLSTLDDNMDIRVPAGQNVFYEFRTDTYCKTMNVTVSALMYGNLITNTSIELAMGKTMITGMISTVVEMGWSVGIIVVIIAIVSCMILATIIYFRQHSKPHKPNI
jgi:hypothetical protein